MKKLVINSLKLLFSTVLIISFVTSCVSKTLIKTVPSEAQVYINDEYVGDTPYVYSDKSTAGSKKNLRLVKEGYKETNTILVRDTLAAGPLVGGIFGTVIFFPAGWIPFLWVLGYDDVHLYTLRNKE